MHPAGPACGVHAFTDRSMHGWAAACLFVPVIGQPLAILAARGVDIAALHGLAVLAALPLILLLLRAPGWSRTGALLLLAWTAWQATTLTHAAVAVPVATSRLALDLVAGTIVLTLMSCQDQSDLLRRFGTAAAIALLVAIAAGVGLGSPHLGFGIPNHLFAAVLPPLAALVWLEWPAGSRTRRMLLAGVLLIATVWALVCLPGQPRRGAMLAMILGLSAPWLWPRIVRRPWLSALMAILVLSGLAVILLVIADAPVATYRTQRLGIWQAAWAAAVAWCPWGGGPWSALHISLLDLDAARIMVTTGSWIDDAHCLPLAQVVEGGAGAAILMVAGLFCAIRRNRRRGAASAPVIAMGVALATCALLDNAYSQPAPRLLFAACLGCMLAGCPGANGRSDRVPTWGLAIAACTAVVWLTWREASMVLLPRRPEADAAIAAIDRTGSPQLAEIAVQVSLARPDATVVDKYRLACAGMHRFGKAQNFIRWRYAACKAMLAAMPVVRAQDMAAQMAGNMLRQDISALAPLILLADPFEPDPMRDVASFQATGTFIEGVTPWMLDAAAAMTAGRVLGEPVGSPMQRDAVRGAAIVGRVLERALQPGDAAAVATLLARYPDCGGVKRISALVEAELARISIDQRWQGSNGGR